MPTDPAYRVLVLTGCLLAACQAADFAPPKDIADGSVSGLSAMAAGDIDGDGLVDVLAAEGGKHAGGRRTFAWFAAPADSQAAWTRHDVDHGASLRAFLGAVAVHDLDGDGDRDIVLCSDRHSGSTRAADILVFFNPGGGVGTWSHHQANADTLPYHHINDLAVGDCDGDGRPDIVVRSLEPNEIHVFFQNGPTDWTRRSVATGLAQSEGLGLGDIDADGLPDITFTGFWLDFTGSPRDATPIRRPIDAGYHAINQNTKEFVADIDGDGDQDVVIGPAESYRNGGDHVLAWYENTGDWSADWPQHVLQADANEMHSVLGGDVDGDGSTDVVVGIPWGDRQVRIYHNDGVGGFAAPQVVHAGKGLYSGVVADLGADGDLDIIGQDAYSGSSKPWIYEQLGGGGTPDRPPELIALTADPSIVTGTTTAVTASATDADGDALAYAWQVAGPDGSDPAWSGSGPSVDLTFAQAGSYTVTCTVEDGRGGSDSDTITVTVQATATEILIGP